jgi:hypothetical protein
MKGIAERYLPYPRILHPWPEQRFLVTILAKLRRNNGPKTLLVRSNFLAGH